MQLNAVASPRGTIVFDNPPVPDTRTAADIMPLRLVRHPGDASDPPASMPARTVCVFDPQAVRRPTHCRAEVRMQGCFLHNAILAAIDCNRHTGRCIRVSPPLPDLPTEQYTIHSTTQHWRDVTVPVDLRPLGGGISVHRVPCTATGEDILVTAASTQSLSLPQHYYCQVGLLVLHPAVQALLIDTGAFVRGILPSDVSQVVVEPEPARVLPPVLPAAEVTPARTVAVIYPNGILLHDVSGNAPTDSDRARTMREIRGELGLLEPAFLRPQVSLAALPSTQMVAVELDDVDSTVLVDLRGLGGSIAFASVLPGATCYTCLFEADVSPGDWSIQQALPALLSSGWLRVHDSASLDQQLPSRRGIRVITAAWGATPRESPPEPDDTPTYPEAPSGTGPARLSPLAWVMLLAAGRSPTFAGVLLCSWALQSYGAHGHPDDMWLAPERPSSSIFKSSLTLATVSAHRRYANLLHTQPAEAVPPSSLVLGNSRRTGSNICIQVWNPDTTHQFVIAAEDIASHLQHRLRLTDPQGQRRMPALVTPQLEWPCVQFVAPHKDPEYVTILVDLGNRLHCFDVTRHRLAADLFHQLRLKCGHDEFRINRGLVASVRHGELLRVFSEHLGEVEEVGSISLNPMPPSACWLGAEDQVYVVGPFLDLIRITPAPREPETTLPLMLLSAYGVEGKIHIIPPLPAEYRMPGPVYCLTPVGQSCHVVIVADVLGHWQRLVIQASLFTSSPDDAIDDLATEARPYHKFWRRVRDSLPILYTVEATLPEQPTVSLLVVDPLRAFQFGWSFSQQDSPATLQTASLSLPGDQHTVGTQTTPSFWPASAAAIGSSAVPQLPAVRSCIPLPQLCPDGPYVQLDCPRFQVQCLLPCLPGYVPWGLRIGIAVFGVCTAEVTWQHVLTIAESSPWDLSGMEIMGDHNLWAWPDDIKDLAGQCGHLLHSGSDPFLCAAGIDSYSHPVLRPSAPNASYPPPSGSSSGTLLAQPRISLLLLGTVHTFHRPLLWGWLWLFSFSIMPGSLVRGMHETSPRHDIADVAIVPLHNTTRTCTVAWGHELSCQANSFEVAVEDVLDYIRLVSPDPLVRIQLWAPYNGPSTFEFHRDDTLARFNQLLVVAGHAPTHRLVVAYDTVGTTLDLLTIPASSVTWWIVRDGLNRELLRPVTLWTEPGARFVLTLNSHGQAQALSCTPEVARLNRLPQGVRATVTLPFTRTVGQMTPSGLVLYEIAVGTVARASMSRLGWVPLLLGIVLSSDIAVAMQAPPGYATPHDLAVPARRYRSTPEPTVTRIWTYTCDAPVEIPFVSAPDLTRMHRQIEGTGRGIPPAGDFVWTSPRVVQPISFMSLHAPCHHMCTGCCITERVGMLLQRPNWSLIGL